MATFPTVPKFVTHHINSQSNGVLVKLGKNFVYVLSKIK